MEDHTFRGTTILKDRVAGHLAIVLMVSVIRV